MEGSKMLFLRGDAGG